MFYSINSQKYNTFFVKDVSMKNVLLFALRKHHEREWQSEISRILSNGNWCLDLDSGNCYGIMVLRAIFLAYTHVTYSKLSQQTRLGLGTLYFRKQNYNSVYYSLAKHEKELCDQSWPWVVSGLSQTFRVGPLKNHSNTYPKIRTEKISIYNFSIYTPPFFFIIEIIYVKLTDLKNCFVFCIKGPPSCGLSHEPNAVYNIWLCDLN